MHFVIAHSLRRRLFAWPSSHIDTMRLREKHAGEWTDYIDTTDTKRLHDCSTRDERLIFLPETWRTLCPME